MSNKPVAHTVRFDVEDDDRHTAEVLAYAADAVCNEGFEDALVILRKPGHFLMVYSNRFKIDGVIPPILSMATKAVQRMPKRGG